MNATYFYYSVNLEKILVKFRTTNHHLPVEYLLHHTVGRCGVVFREVNVIVICVMHGSPIADEFQFI